VNLGDGEREPNGGVDGGELGWTQDGDPLGEQGLGDSRDGIAVHHATSWQAVGRSEWNLDGNVADGPCDGRDADEAADGIGRISREQEERASPFLRHEGRHRQCLLALDFSPGLRLPPVAGLIRAIELRFPLGGEPVLLRPANHPATRGLQSLSDCLHRLEFALGDRDGYLRRTCRFGSTLPGMTVIIPDCGSFSRGASSRMVRQAADPTSALGVRSRGDGSGKVCDRYRGTLIGEGIGDAMGLLDE
jgi:hypothetical protein